MFPSEEAAMLYLEEKRWGGNPECPHCGSKRVKLSHKPNRQHWCSHCRKRFSVRAKTIMARSKIRVWKWLYTIYLLVFERNGISSVSLGKMLKIEQKSAHRLLQRIRHAMKDEYGLLKGYMEGIVEVDEVYHGGHNKNRHNNKKLSMAEANARKMKVIGAVERTTGRRILQYVPKLDKETTTSFVLQNVKLGSVLCTDESSLYNDLENDYVRKSVCHGSREYVDGATHTNTIESTWACFTRQYITTYHHYTHKYCQLYANQCAFMLSYAKEKYSTLESMNNLIGNIFRAPPMTYKEISDYYQPMAWSG